jgi:hypothetical protein
MRRKEMVYAAVPMYIRSWFEILCNMRPAIIYTLCQQTRVILLTVGAPTLTMIPEIAIGNKWTAVSSAEKCQTCCMNNAAKNAAMGKDMNPRRRITIT